MARETETKIELTAASFARLLARWPVVSRTEQLNVYYDADGRIAQRGGSFRIRYVCGAPPIVTLKRNLESSGGHRVSEEVERPARRRLPARVIDPLHDLDAAFLPILRSWRVAQLRRLGAMRTERTVVRLAGGTEVELDRVSLPDGSILYEAEIESDDAASHAAAVAEVKAAAPDWRYSTMGKFHRFVRATHG